MSSERLYSAEETAEVLGLQVRTVRGYIRDGRLAAVRIGKQYRIRATDLDAFTGSGTIKQKLSLGSPDHRDLGRDGSGSGSPFVSGNGIFTVVDIENVSPEQVAAMQQTVVAAVGPKGTVDADLGPGSVDYAHDVDRAHLRVMISGTVAYVIRILRLVQGLTEERGNLQPRVGRSRW